MKLFHVESPDFDCHIVAAGWQEAVDAWKNHINAVEPGEPSLGPEDALEPETVTLSAEANDGDFPGLILP